MVTQGEGKQVSLTLCQIALHKQIGKSRKLLNSNTDLKPQSRPIACCKEANPEEANSSIVEQQSKPSLNAELHLFRKRETHLAALHFTRATFKRTGA
jgi:hypothetical protein